MTGDFRLPCLVTSRSQAFIYTVSTFLSFTAVEVHPQEPRR
jgi:hypothetical protein